MKRFTLFFLLSVFLGSCSNHSSAPDVSGIKIDLTVERFERDFFSADTINLDASLQELQKKYPGFLNDFTTNILGLPSITDTSLETKKAIKKFIADYKPLKDSAEKVFADFGVFEKEIKQGLQFVKYYFPGYPVPQKLITFIGPMDAFYEASLGGFGDVLTGDGLAIGLQLHFGNQFSYYHSQMGEALYPNYISLRFTPEYIAVNCMKNIIDDLYPQRASSKPLVEQMIEKGKRLYVLDKIMPFISDTLKIGYTSSQLKGCFANEGRIWNYFLTNNLLLNNEPDLLKTYMGDGPSTPELGEGSPGYIGLFVGWQIIKKYMEKNEKFTLPQLLQTDSRKIFEESKYRPK